MTPVTNHPKPGVSGIHKFWLQHEIYITSPKSTRTTTSDETLLNEPQNLERVKDDEDFPSLSSKSLGHTYNSYRACSI